MEFVRSFRLSAGSAPIVSLLQHAGRKCFTMGCNVVTSVTSPAEERIMDHDIHEHHEKAAHHHDEAAKHHREAAKHHKSGHHEKAAHHTKVAHGHSLHATDHHHHASKKHAEHHG
jgi:hypothetical protein